MTTAHDIDWPQVLAERLTTTHPDVLRELLATFIHTLMGAEADALCGAEYGQRSTERTNQRNGYRQRQFDTRTGSLDLAIPKLRHGSYFPDWLLERRKRAERALTTVVATCYLLGVSTRRMDKLVGTLGITSFIHTLMGAEADALCGAEYGQRSTERTNQRNGYRQRQFDTRTGSLDLAIPKLRHGSYFPDWLLERRKRAERALTTVVATCYLLGVSTRRMDKLVGTLGITSLSKSQVSVMAKELDTAVEAFRSRPLDGGPYTFVAADALVLKVREDGRVVNVHALIAVGVNAEGYREILGIDVTTAEDGAGWLTFLRSLTARGLSGVKLVTSDAHAGLLTRLSWAGFSLTEGDLIMGEANKTAIATLVERATRYTMLVHLPDGHHAEAVRDGLISTISTLPAHLRGSLTWDQGAEMARHKQFSMATEMAVYFCDPASPWQRGTNENTNGLLRQYFPKGTDLSLFGPDDLEHVAQQLNGRPRKTLGWETPAERLRDLLVPN